MGGINFAWLAVWVLSPDFFQAFRWSRRAWGRGVRALPRLCIVNPGICRTTEETPGFKLLRDFQPNLCPLKKPYRLLKNGPHFVHVEVFNRDGNSLA